MSERDDGGPAFPYSALQPDESTRQLVGSIYADNVGMTKREVFAMHALGVAYADIASRDPRFTGGWGAVTQIAYVIADHMLVERTR